MHASEHINIQSRGSVQFLSAMAGDKVTLLKLAEGGRFSGTAFASVCASGAEGTA